MPSDCPLCLQNNLFETEVLFQNENVFLAEAARFPGHYLIIPIAHITELADLPDTWWASFKQGLTHIKNLPAAYNLSLNYGRLAGQTVSHLHFWIVPRADGEPAANKGLATLVSLVNQGC